MTQSIESMIEVRTRLDSAEKLIEQLVKALNRECESQWDGGYEINPWITETLAAAKLWKEQR